MTARAQQKYIEELRDTYKDKLPLAKVPLMPFEVKGVEALIEVGKILFPQTS